MGFGLVPAVLACLLASPSPNGRRGWLFGAACSLLGALGVFGLGHGGFFLMAWELMSLGGAAMILSERLAPAPGAPVLFMLGMLETGAIALLIAVLLLALPAKGLAFETFARVGPGLSAPVQITIGILLVIGFGAKLGLLPFYEWFPGAYGSGSGASGALLSGVILNAAFFGLSRGLLDWLPKGSAMGSGGLGIFVVAVGVFSAILAVLYAFQQEDWRRLLAFSSAENAAIAVAALGASILFRDNRLPDLAGLAWTVALIHLAGHALAKGALFLTADGVYAATGAYLIRHSPLAKRTSWIFGVGALFAAMSLAAMPPQAGFVSEWYVFQTVFQGFHLPSLPGRLALALAGAGLALTAAVAFATFIKVFGIGLLGGGNHRAGQVGVATIGAVGTLGGCVLALAVGMPAWLGSLVQRIGRSVRHRQSQSDAGRAAAGAPHGEVRLHLAEPDGDCHAAARAHTGWSHPDQPAADESAVYAVRRAPVWYGGVPQDVARTATTALTFSNALRTFYSFIYRPTVETTRESRQVANTS